MVSLSSEVPCFTTTLLLWLLRSPLSLGCLRCELYYLFLCIFLSTLHDEVLKAMQIGNVLWPSLIHDICIFLSILILSFEEPTITTNQKMEMASWSKLFCSSMFQC